MTLRRVVPVANTQPNTVYLAAPIYTYKTPRYEQALAWVHRQFPHVRVVNARDAFLSNADWRARWPLLLDHMHTLVFIADESGFIGKGVWQEVTDARACGLLVLWLGYDGMLRTLDAFTLGPPDECDWKHYCRVCERSDRGTLRSNHADADMIPPATSQCGTGSTGGPRETQ